MNCCFRQFLVWFLSISLHCNHSQWSRSNNQKGWKMKYSNIFMLLKNIQFYSISLLQALDFSQKMSWSKWLMLSADLDWIIVLEIDILAAVCCSKHFNSVKWKASLSSFTFYSVMALCLWFSVAMDGSCPELAKMIWPNLLRDCLETIRYDNANPGVKLRRLSSSTLIPY